MTDNDLKTRPSKTAVVETSATAIDTSRIIGWGVDADPDNDPTYPYRNRSADDHSGTWRRPTTQNSDVEVLQSIEHKQTPAVFGTSTPPSWLSGVLRRQAFRWSESNWVHWLMLLGADRINMVEGLVQDLGRGKIPNIPKEMGLPAAWKHNRKGVITTGLVTAGVIAALVAVTRSRKD